MIYLILGMHKSGTTLLSRTLHASGIRMVEEEYEHADYDAGGKYEWTAFQDINAELLKSDGTPSLEIDLDQELSISNPVIHRARALVKKCEENEADWGFKDPRTTLTYPFWRRILPEHRIIGIFRHPEEVHYHYTYEPRQYCKRLMPVLTHWTVYNQRLFDYNEELEEGYPVFNYQHILLKDKPFTVLQNYAQRELCDIRDPTKYRNRRRNGKLFRLAETVYFLKTGNNPRRCYQQLEELCPC